VRKAVRPTVEDNNMNIIYLNRWGVGYHAILTTVTEEEDRVLASRVCMSLEEARRMIEAWRVQYGIATQEIRDNSRLDLTELLAGIETNFRPRNN
jgi:hypothetical protein